MTATDERAAAAPAVPAQPGFFVLRFFGGDTEDDKSLVSKDPVVAWRIDGWDALPVALHENNHEDEYSILCPDGRVIDPGNYHHDDEAAWRAFEERSHRDALREGKASLRRAGIALTTKDIDTATGSLEALARPVDQLRATEMEDYATTLTAALIGLTEVPILAVVEAVCATEARRVAEAITRMAQIVIGAGKLLKIDQPENGGPAAQETATPGHA
jgi:hypothetical protein